MLFVEKNCETILYNKQFLLLERKNIFFLSNNKNCRDKNLIFQIRSSQFLF